MNRDQFDFVDIPRLMRQIADEHELRDGDVLLALVREPGSMQELVCVERLPETAYLSDYQDARDLIYETMRRLPITERDDAGIHFRTLTVLVRRGLTVFGPYESNWMLAWRYSNHLRDAFSTDVALVTEHGWLDFMSDEAGYEPALVA